MLQRFVFGPDGPEEHVGPIGEPRSGLCISRIWRDDQMRILRARFYIVRLQDDARVEGIDACPGIWRWD